MTLATLAGLIRYLRVGVPVVWEKAEGTQIENSCPRNYPAIVGQDMELGLATFADLSSGVSPQQRMRDLIEEAVLAEQVGPRRVRHRRAPPARTS